MHARQNRSLRGFTLIELLVVVAIIALLIAIMLPSLSRAHELTRRAACRGNIRAIAAALVLYAQDNDDAVPLACWQSGGRALRRLNYFINDRYRNPPRPLPRNLIVPGGHLGMLLQPGNEYMEKGQEFYCPSAKDPMWQFNDDPSNPTNLWWDVAGSGLVRLGYGTRPVVGWFNNGIPPWRDDRPLTAAELLNTNGNLPRMSTPTPLHYNGRRMMISFRSTDAMVADVSNTPWRVDKFHVDGVNVGWFDGSVHWFDRGGFNDVWQQWPAGGYGNAAVEDDCHYKAESVRVRVGGRDVETGDVRIEGVWAEMGG